MPKIDWAQDQAESDARWLPRLAPHLPAAVPVPVHVGRPSAGYPWVWSVVPWVRGSTPPRLGVDDVRQAQDLAAFALTLRAVDATGGPTKPPGSRGTPLVHADAGAGQASNACAPTTTASTSLPPSAPGTCASPPPTGAATRFGSTATSSPATSSSTTAASSPSSTGAPSASATRLPTSPLRCGRSRARPGTATARRSAPDDATWLRACGWALAPSLTGIDYYRHTFPRMAEHGRRMVPAVVAELT